MLHVKFCRGEKKRPQKNCFKAAASFYTTIHTRLDKPGEISGMCCSAMAYQRLKLKFYGREARPLRVLLVTGEQMKVSKRRTFKYHKGIRNICKEKRFNQCGPAR